MASATAITHVRKDGGGTPVIESYGEAATQTFKTGVPVFLSSGFVTVVTANWSGTERCLGISNSPGSNLAVAGVAQELSEQTPANQPNAISTPVGARVRTGNAAVVHADSNNVFRIALTDGQTGTAALVAPGTRYAMDRNANLLWEIDSTDTGTGNQHVAEIVGLDPNDAEYVFFKFTSSRRAN